MKIQKSLHLLSTLLLMSILISSCASTKKLRNFQDIDVAVAQAEVVNYQTKIKCDDELSILVSCSDMALAQQYNINVPSNYMGTSSIGATQQVGTTTSDVTYRVDSSGEINFPVLGKIKVEGMTRAEAVEYLTAEIKKDIKDPVVTITVTNFNITIIGEISSPGNYTFNSEKVNIVQAIAEAGDLTSNSIRDDILLIRNINGRHQYISLDMTKKHILESELFYLQQNDILYVKTDIVAERASDIKTWWTTGISTITSTISFITVIIALLL